jgi:predicted PurR-regulated permease PerM
MLPPMPRQRLSRVPPLPADKAKPRSWSRIWLPRVGAAAVVALTVISVATWVFEATANFLITLLIAVFVAFALLPAVDYLVRRGWRRGPATALVMAVGGLVGLAFLLAFTQVLVNQVISLIEKAPDYVESIAGWLNDTFGIEINVDETVTQLTGNRQQLTEVAANALGGILGLATTALGIIFQAFTVALFVFYILADLPKLREALLGRFPPAQQLHIDTITSITVEKVGGYVYSRLLLALCSFAFHFVVFTVIGLPYAFAMAVWVGLVSQFIPTVGTYLAGALPTLIALVDEDPIDALWVIISVTVYQQFENYFIAPRVTANTMEIHPAVAFGSVIVGAGLLGGVGALLALPAAAVIAALVSTYADHYEVIASETIESTDDYEERMRALGEEKDKKWSDRKERIKASVGRLQDGLAPGDDADGADRGPSGSTPDPTPD